MTRPIHVLAFAELQPQFEADALDIFRTLAHASRREPGCLRFDLYRDTDNPQRFNLIGVFVDEAAIRLHLETPHRKAALDALAGKLVGATEFRMLQAVDVTSGV